MLSAIDSANVTHSIWCEQVSEMDFEYVGCTCGALKQEMLNLRQEADAKCWRWCMEHPYETMHILMEATNRDSYSWWPETGREVTIEEVREYLAHEVDGGWDARSKND